jgi:hypothetical protein
MDRPDRAQAAGLAAAVRFLRQLAAAALVVAVVVAGLIAAVVVLETGHRRWRRARGAARGAHRR